KLGVGCDDGSVGTVGRELSQGEYGLQSRDTSADDNDAELPLMRSGFRHGGDAKPRLRVRSCAREAMDGLGSGRLPTRSCVSPTELDRRAHYAFQRWRVGHVYLGQKRVAASTIQRPNGCLFVAGTMAVSWAGECRRERGGPSS